jgi:hypothetical protein
MITATTSNTVIIMAASLGESMVSSMCSLARKIICEMDQVRLSGETDHGSLIIGIIITAK